MSNDMRPAKGKRRFGAGLAVVTLIALLIVLSKVALLVRVDATAIQFAAGLLPSLLISLLCIGAYLSIATVRPAWAKRLGKAAVLIAVLFIGSLTVFAAVGFWQTGSIPRLQQFRGLTWDIIAPSVIEIVKKNMSGIVMAVAGAVVLLALFGFVMTRVQWARFLRHYLAVLGVLVLAIIGVVVFGSDSGVARYNEVMGVRFFRVDLDLDSASSPSAQLVEAKFFKWYDDRLRQKIGRRYPDVYEKLKGSNIIYVVLESVRAKDVPLYGGPAVMPNMMAARQHMILLQNLYSQDPRSTKAFPEMDMGRFSLLSWNSYSDNIPWMFPEDGVASHLDKLGYKTFSLVDSDKYLDHNRNFQEHHGYQTVLYRQAINPNSPDADDLKLLAHVKTELANVHQPLYMMVWPIETHHPYGREFWSNKDAWTHSHPAGMEHRGAADHERYLRALHEVDDWFGRLIQILKEEGKYEDTVLIVTGDHGEAFGEHEPGNVFHGNGVYEESTHVAGFLYSPKINGLHVDDRYMRLVDMPATIIDLASGSQYLLNAGRSMFYSYKYPMPVYLFNSWAGAAGIIFDGYKLWRREAPGSPVYFASMASIRADSAMERRAATGKDDQKLLEMLDTWETAMKARTADLLVRKDTAQPPLDDVVRIYCDDGKGFREGFKDWVDFTGLSGTVTIPIDKNCRALRIAPIQSTKLPDGKYLHFDIKKMKVVANDRSWSLQDLKVIWSNGLHVINNHEFGLLPGHSAFDYKLDSVNHHIKSVKMTIAFSWRHVETASSTLAK